MFPLKPRMSKGVTLCIAGVIWVASAILSSPNIAYSTTKLEKFSNGQERTICYTVWPDGPSPLSYQEYIYNVIILLVTYVLPISSMTYTYSRIGKELWGSQSIGECTDRQLENVKSKRRIVKMMIVVVVIFAVCWLPYHVYFLVSHHYPEISDLPFIQHIYLLLAIRECILALLANADFSKLLAIRECILALFANAHFSKFRGGFKKVFRWCPGIELTDTEMMYEQRPNRATMHSYSYAADNVRPIRNGITAATNRKPNRATEIEFTELTRTIAKVDL
ncbi:Tachykinin-like peptides receptor 99D [Nymphon striatum]|nr:Tachykinin-like peptides receptor 99D [Nymphon striatum]